MAGGFSKARIERVRSVLQTYVDRGDLPGLVAIASRGEETHVEAIGKLAFDGAPVQRDSTFRIASMSKPITAVATMILVEECKLRLDDPVDAFLPELANRRVLRQPNAGLDDTVPAKRAITVRDLLTFRCGLGAVMAPPGTLPIQKAIAGLGLAPGPDQLPFFAQEFMRRVGTLPLIHQPGEQWMYHTGSDLLGVLIARVTGGGFGEFLAERVFAPLGMKNTGFYVRPENRSRLATTYKRETESNKLVVHEPQGENWFVPPKFEAGGSGLVSTADDYLAFCKMMLGKGRLGATRVLSRASVELMTMDHLSPAQKRGMEMFFGDGEGGFRAGWGFGLGIETKRSDLASFPGRFGWVGGRGTVAMSDPTNDVVGILMTQRMLESPVQPPVMSDFWTTVYQAIDD